MLFRSTLGITEHISGVDNVQSLSNLALMTGNLGRPGTGINPMRGQNNIQGAGDCGALPNNFPGFQPVTEPEFQEKFSKAYGREIDLAKGITKVRALEQCGEKVFGMLVCGENTVVSDPDMDHCEHALKSLEHLVVIDVFLTETAELADVVLPASAWGETDGVFTNTERRVQRVRAAVPAQGESRPDWWILAELSNATVLTVGPTLEDGSAASFQIKVANPAGIDGDANISDTVVAALVEDAQPVARRVERRQPAADEGDEEAVLRGGDGDHAARPLIVRGARRRAAARVGHPVGG